MMLLSNGSLYMRNSGEVRLRSTDEGGYQCRADDQTHAVVSRNAMLKLSCEDATMLIQYYSLS